MAVHGIIGKKVGMTQIFTADGTVVPVTVVQAGPCLVVQKKTADKEGYDALQIGLVGSRPDRRANRARKGHFDRAGVAPMRNVAEVALVGDDELKPGDPAPDFTLPGSDGRTYRLKELAGRPVVLAWFPKAFTGG